MGVRFSLQHANIVAYLTGPKITETPRIRRAHLHDFLISLTYSPMFPDTIISSRPSWVEQVRGIAEQCLNFLDKYPKRAENAFLDSLTEELLGPLRDCFQNFQYFGMPIGVQADYKALNDFAQRAAIESGEHGLFLIPEFPPVIENFEVYDPSPIIRDALLYVNRWPGVLFWLPDGTAAFLGMGNAERFFYKVLMREGRQPYELSRSMRRTKAWQRELEPKRILHLSDLHFGTKAATKNRETLVQHLFEKEESFDRIVITGDLFNHPRARKAREFEDFWLDMIARTGKAPVVIPGNHDCRFWGNKFFFLLERHRVMADLEWSSLVIDDELNILFLCFNSSEVGNIARGKIPTQQYQKIEKTIKSYAIKRPEILFYQRVVLVHHHPFSFDSASETPVLRGPKFLRLLEEWGLKMLDSETFLEWCAKKDVSHILHGHKHLQRNVKQLVHFDGKVTELRAIGCGTSLGAEGYDLSYNIIQWEPWARRWATSFYSKSESDIDFQERLIDVKVVPELVVSQS